MNQKYTWSIVAIILALLLSMTNSSVGRSSFDALNAQNDDPIIKFEWGITVWPTEPGGYILCFCVKDASGVKDKCMPCAAKSSTKTIIEG